MSVLLFAYVYMLTAFETLSLLQNLVNKKSESGFISAGVCNVDGYKK